MPAPPPWPEATFHPGHVRDPARLRPRPRVQARISVCPRASAGWTPLHHCAARGKDGAVESLLRAGAEAAAIDAAGTTPLHLAAERGHAMTAFLLASRAPAACRARNAGNATPPDLAHDLKHGEVEARRCAQPLRTCRPAHCQRRLSIWANRQPCAQGCCSDSMAHA